MDRVRTDKVRRRTGIVKRVGQASKTGSVAVVWARGKNGGRAFGEEDN